MPSRRARVGSVHSSRYKTIPELLKEARVCAGMTQVQVAAPWGATVLRGEMRSGERRSMWSS